MMMRMLVLFLVVTVIQIYPASGQDAAGTEGAADSEQNKIVDEILNCLEKRYDGAGFSARFFQASTLQAMKITDTANGQAYFKRPGMMKWEYLKPDRQQIITDGTMLWIYRPEDKQVAVGGFPSFFGDGKGAGFLSDIRLIRKKFVVSLGENLAAGETLLKLWPREKNIDISVIHLTISMDTCDVIRITTYNAYGDETRIDFSDIDFSSPPSNEMFHFTIPPGTDIVRMDP